MDDFLKTKLKEEATCSICLGYFIDPVLLDCGHNFCRGCINQCWMELPTNTACPQCRKAVATTNCRPNRALVNVVEILKQVNNEEEEEESGDKICREHAEPAEIVFCKEDQVSLCPVCDRSEKHRYHHMVPLREAVQEYKNRFHSCLEVRLNEKKEILIHKVNAVRESEELTKQIETEKQKAMSEFKRLHRFLAEQEAFLLTKIKAVARDLGNKKTEQLCKLSADLVTLQNTTQLLQEKCQQSDNKLLQDAEKILEKYEKMPTFQPPEDIPLELKWRIWELYELNALLEGLSKHFRNSLKDGYQLHEVNVILDPESAHPQLLLSKDGKSITWTQTLRDVPKTQKRFETHFCVAGYPQITAGRHFWDVVVEGKENWAVGVVSSSVDRKDLNYLTTEAGCFAMGRGPMADRSLSTPEETEKRKKVDEMKKVRVSLNCGGGQVVFYDAEKAEKIFCFDNASFHKEVLQPFFWLRGRGEIRISPD